ncbi:MAG: murein biosynthesis integral membrane protein MurJ [Deltaproteobacteria bacterium]|nr:murein biosynthesis integral membrane protein MurJ [Deltaproteobacteria bacterium]
MVTRSDQRRLEQLPVHLTAEAEERTILRAAGQIGFFTILSRITGLIRDVVIGSVFGVGVQTDAFFVAFRIPNLLRRVVGEGAAAAAIVPVLSEYLARRSRAEAMDVVRSLWGMGIIMLCLSTAVGLFYTAAIVHVFAPGFSGAKLELTVTLTHLMFFYLFCIGGVALTMGVLHALRHFAAPAFAPVLFNFAIIACALWLSRILTEPVVSLAYGVVFGGICQLAWQIPPLVRLRVPLLPRWQPGHPALKRIGVLLLPLLFGAGIYQVNQIVSTLFASMLVEGSVSALWYANRLFEFPVGVFVTALGTAVLPSLAVQALQPDPRQLRERLGFALRLVNLITLPAAVGLIVLAEPLSSVLFLHGAFGTTAVRDTAGALQGYAVGLWMVATTRMLSACLYALQDTRTPVVGATVSFVVKLVFSLMLMGEVTSSGDDRTLVRIIAKLSATMGIVNWGVSGLAFATSGAAFVGLLVQAIILYRRLGFPWAAWWSSVLWSLAGCGVMALPLWWIAGRIVWLETNVSFVERGAVLTLAILVGSVSYLVIAWKGGEKEFRALAGLLPQRALRLFPQRFQPRG